jgi:hypothetical protein
MARSDDEALSWDGDDDPTLEAAGDAQPRASLPKGWRAVGRGSEAFEAEPDEAVPASAEPDPAPAESAAGSAAAETDAEDPGHEAAGDERAPLGNAALVSLGVIGGVYLLWTVGWFIGASRLRDWIERSTDTVADFMFQGSVALAIAAPAIWFLTAWVGTRKAPSWQRFLWLAAGIVLLVPWPFVMVGVIGR